jgi:hypothetical protein
LKKQDPKTQKKQIGAMSSERRWRPATTWWKASRQSYLWRDKSSNRRKCLKRGGCYLWRGRKERGEEEGESRGGGVEEGVIFLLCPKHSKGKGGFWFVLREEKAERERSSRTVYIRVDIYHYL